MITILLSVLALGTPFSDDAVLQRDRPVPVWGTAEPGEAVTVTFAGQTKTATAATNGLWRVTLDPMPASAEPKTLTAVAAATKCVITNVVVGEVWFASGQSNMDCPLWVNGHTRYRERNGGLMTAMTHLPMLRYVKCPHVWSAAPRTYKTAWRVATRANLERYGISAVAFYYARELHLALGIPVGIVDASWGGTNIDAWTPRAGYADCDASIRDTADWKVLAHDFKGTRPISSAHQQPTVLFNGMVAAWTPMAMRGFIWYQGCHNANVGEAERYCAKMHALYNGWSRAFENPGLKLYFAQLAPYGGGFLRIIDQQNRFAAEEPNAAIAVLSDVGNPVDIHPNDKETVAQRLVVHALKRDYGRDIPEDDSPTFRSAAVSNDCLVLRFDHVKDWYVYAPSHAKDVPFEVAGTNGVWKKAKILNFRPRPDKKWADEWRIDAPELVVRGEGVPEPVAVRYMASGEAGTLYSDVSLPLGAFAASVEGCDVARDIVRLEAGRIPTNSVGRVIRDLEIKGVDCKSYRKRYNCTK